MKKTKALFQCRQRIGKDEVEFKGKAEWRDGDSSGDGVSSMAPVQSRGPEEDVFVRSRSWLLCVEYAETEEGTKTL